MGAVLLHVTMGVGCDDTIAEAWRLHSLEWPDTDDSVMPQQTEAEEDCSDLEAKFDMLRLHFAAVRDRAS